MLKRKVVRVLDVWHKLSALGRHDCFQLGNDDSGFRFELGQPWEQCAGMEFALNQTWKMKMGRLTVKMSCAAQRIAPETRDAFPLLVIRLLLSNGHRGFQSLLARIEPGSVPTLPLRKYRGHLRR